jgi:hypothetical protein
MARLRAGVSHSAVDRGRALRPTWIAAPFSRAAGRRARPLRRGACHHVGAARQHVGASAQHVGATGQRFGERAQQIRAADPICWVAPSDLLRDFTDVLGDFTDVLRGFTDVLRDFTDVASRSPDVASRSPDAASRSPDPPAAPADAKPRFPAPFQAIRLPHPTPPR